MKSIKYLSALFLIIYSSLSSADFLPIGSTTCRLEASTYCNNAYGPDPNYALAISSGCNGNPDLTLWRCYRNIDGDPCPDGGDWNQSTGSCDVACVDRSGDDAGLIENSISPPGYEYLCMGGCAVEASEFFQRTDNDLWVIAYRFTGQECGSGDPLTEPDIPAGDPAPPSYTPTVPTDTDGDGTPDGDDSDIDDDGTPNGTDDDVDGDGIPNGDDLNPNGEKDDESKAYTSLDCNQSPSCQGDAIQCQQLFEIWRLRCKTNENEKLTQQKVDQVSQAFDDRVDSELDAVTQEITDSLGDPSGIQLGSSIGDKFKDLFPSVPCSDYTINWIRPFTLECSKTAIIREAFGYAFAAMVIVALYNIARERPS